MLGLRAHVFSPCAQKLMWAASSQAMGDGEKRLYWHLADVFVTQGQWRMNVHPIVFKETQTLSGFEPK